MFSILGTPQRSTTCTVTVTVSDINDNPPLFNQTDVSITLSTKATAAGTDIYTVTATDADINENSEVTYSLTTIKRDAVFYIDNTTGVVSTSITPRPGLHRLNITAEDGGDPLKLSSSMILSIMVIELGRYTCASLLTIIHNFFY